MDITNLIEKAEKIRESKETKTRKRILIKRYQELGFEDPYVVLEKPSLAQVVAIEERKSPEYTLEVCIKSPDLHNKELQKAFKANNAKALMNKLFTEEEKLEMATVTSALIQGKTNIEVVEEVKN